MSSAKGLGEESPASPTESLAYPAAAARKDEQSRPDVPPPAEVKVEKPEPAKAIPLQQPAKPCNTPQAQVKDEPAASPTAPSPGAVASPGQAVHSMLNRAATTDRLDLATLQDMVNKSVQAATSAASEAPPKTLPEGSVIEHGDEKITGRNKQAHNRRMRFYRSLDSHLLAWYIRNIWFGYHRRSFKIYDA